MIDENENIGDYFGFQPEPPWRWYSICSKHYNFDSECTACSTGNWVDESSSEWIEDQALWKRDPDAWRDLHRNDQLTFTDREGSPVNPFPRLTQWLTRTSRNCENFSQEIA